MKKRKTIIELNTILNNRFPNNNLIIVRRINTRMCEVKDEFGICIKNVGDLLRGSKTSIKSAKHPLKYFKNKLKTKNKYYHNKEFKVISFYKERIYDKKYVIVKNKYGYQKIRTNQLLRNYESGIRSAIFPHNYFLNQLEDSNINYRKRKFKVISKYSSKVAFILVEDKYGKCKIRTKNLINGVSSNIRNAINKDEYIKNKLSKEIKSIYGYEKVKYSDKLSQVTLVCPYHGDFKVVLHNYMNKRGKHYCKKCKYLHNSFSKSGWVKKAKGKIGKCYLLKVYNDEEVFLKIGITFNSLKTRYNCKKLMPYEYEVVQIVKDKDNNKIWELENKIKTQFKDFRYSPKLPFHGSYLECFTFDKLEQIKKTLNGNVLTKELLNEVSKTIKL